MAALILYVTEPGTIVRKRDERLILNRDKKIVGDFPLLNVEQVVLIGNRIEITSEAIRTLAKRQIPLTFMSGTLELVARVEGDFSLFGKLRFLQARFVDNAANQLGLARLIVRGKLLNQIFVLSQERQGSSARRIGRVLDNLSGARDLDQLRGFEGQAAALYFDGVRQTLPQLREWGFERRAFFPPPDPFNALLSLGYSLATREVLAAVNIVGFDPHLGFFHSINYGRPSLALDLVEEFRPVMDRLVITLVKTGEVRLHDFEQLSSAPPPRPLTSRIRMNQRIEESIAEDEEEKLESKRGPTWRLKPEARKRFLRHYEELMNQYFYYENEARKRRLREIILAQGYQIAALVQGKSDTYLPFLLKSGEERR